MNIYQTNDFKDYMDIRTSSLSKTFTINKQSFNQSEYKVDNLIKKVKKNNSLLKKNEYEDALLITSQTSTLQVDVLNQRKHTQRKSLMQKQIIDDAAKLLLKLPKITSQEKEYTTLISPINLSSKKYADQRLKISSVYKSKAMRRLAETLLNHYRQASNKKNELQLQGSKVSHFERSKVKKKQLQIKNVELLNTERNRSLILKNQQRKIIKLKEQASIKIKNQSFFQYQLFLKFILYLNKINEFQHPRKRYKFYVAQGNNSFLVKSIIRHRFWWNIVPTKNQANFVWTQNKCKQFVEKLHSYQPHKQIDIEYEQNEEDTTYPERQQQQSFAINKLQNSQTILIGDLNHLQKYDYKSFKYVREHQENYKQLLAKFIKEDDCKQLQHLSIESYVKLMKKQSFQTIKQKNYIMHNHLECHWNLSNKKALFANMKKYYEEQKENPFKYIPRTYHIKEVKDSQYNSLEQYFKLSKSIWIIKPGQNTNRGNGINLAQTWIQIEKFVTLGCVNGRTVIVQEYILPFLYNNRKFDIRCYILITSLNKKIKGYWYQEGYIRTSSKQFNLYNIGNKMIHLTNDAIQNKGEDYGKYQAYNKLSFKQMEKYFAEHRRNFETVKREMKSLAKDCIKASFQKLDPKKRKFTFQIFGLDFLIDNKAKTWLIQANTNPCLELSGNLLARIIPHMLQNTFRIALDPIFTPPQYEKWTVSRRIEYSTRIFSNNKYELIFDEDE